MTDWARHVTGYSNFTFLNKPIIAPTISHELKTASFNPASFVDMGDAGLDSLLTYTNRHFASLFGRAPAPPPSRELPDTAIVKPPLHTAARQRGTPTHTHTPPHRPSQVPRLAWPRSSTSPAPNS